MLFVSVFWSEDKKMGRIDKNNLCVFIVRVIIEYFGSILNVYFLISLTREETTSNPSRQ
jgi:hypothetical protein